MLRKAGLVEGGKRGGKRTGARPGEQGKHSGTFAGLRQLLENRVSIQGLWAKATAGEHLWLG